MAGKDKMYRSMKSTYMCKKKTEYTYQNINKLNSCDNDKKYLKRIILWKLSKVFI